MKGEERKGPVFYYEWQDQIEKLPEQYQLPVIKAIWHYDRYNEKLNTEDGLLDVLLEKFYYEVDKQKTNWENKAGRPAKYSLDDFTPLFAQGMKDAEIARLIGCSTKTVQRKRKEWSSYVHDLSSKTGQDKDEYVSYVLSRTLSSPILSNFVQARDNGYNDLPDGGKELGF